MTEYTISITETLLRYVTTKANNLDEAIAKVKKMYENEEIVLDAQDYIGTDIAPVSNLYDGDEFDDHTPKYALTEHGWSVVKNFIANCEAKRKEILDAGKDTASDIILPTPRDIICDIEFFGIDDDGLYCNSWGVTDNYDSDTPCCLMLNTDFVEINTL